MRPSTRASQTARRWWVMRRPAKGRKRRLPATFPRIFACLLAGASCWTAPAAADGGEFPRSSASDLPLPGVVRAPLPPDEVNGLPLATVFYDLRGTAGITGGDERARLEIEKAFGIKAGDVFDPQAAQIGLMRVRKLGFVREAHFTVFESSRPGHLVLSLSATLGTREDPAGPRGMATGRAVDFPIIYRDDRVSVRVLVNGGLGLFSDGDPWFGDAAAFTGLSPIALDPADGDSATWFESSIEYGLGGVFQLGDGDFWAYGASSWITSFATGQDLFRSDTRDRTEIEDAYVGVVFQTRDSKWVVDASVGGQNWQLNDGFLFSQFSGSANAGPLPGLFLNPRTAHEMTALLKVRRKNFRLEAFYLDPNEIDFLESDTTFLGLNAAYTSPRGSEGSLAFFEVAESKTTFAAGPAGRVPREGQQTGNARIATSRLFGIDGLEWGGELAYQTHRDVDWDAWAWYSRVGHTFRDLPWTPNLSYRYASFSGDDPATGTYEGFDAPLSSGLDTWVQGVNIRKVAANGNLDSHRLRLNLAASEKFSLTFDYFSLRANESAGGPREIGQEIDLAVRWSINRNLFFLGVAGVAFPGDRLREQAGSDLDSWRTIQWSLFWSL